MTAVIKERGRSLIEEMLPDHGSEIDVLRAGVQTVTLPAGQTVFRRGDACKGYIVVIDGRVRVQMISASGREVLLYKVNDNESCVITTSCLISQDSYPAEAITEVETTALVLPQPVFDQALAVSNPFRRFVFANQGQRLSDLILRMEDVVFERLDVRLSKLLLEYSDNGVVPVTATHQQLASELGSAREVVSRQLKSFERKGWIELGRGSVNICDSKALISITNDA